MEFTKVFWNLYEAATHSPRYISMPGGTRSGKTYSILQLLYQVVKDKDKAGDITSVVSETLPHLKRGAIRDFERIIDHPLKNDSHWNASDLVYTFDNGAKLEFFSADSSDKVLGPSRRRLFLNECNHISYDTARQLFVRTTGTIFMDYNPAASFWAIEHIEPKANCITIHSTYKDNDYLSDEQIAEIESYQGDKNWWQVYGLGLLGSLDGVIYTFEQVDALPVNDGHMVEVGGIDFGFNDPTSIVRIMADRRKKVAYIRQVAYRRHMKNADIAQALTDAAFPRHVHIWADAAEPKSIQEIADTTHLQVRACDKSAPVKSDRRKFQIQWLQGWTLYITKDSTEVIKDMRNYTWEKDGDGNLTNIPIHTFSHAPDSIRYALYSEFANGAGNYTISIQ